MIRNSPRNIVLDEDIYLEIAKGNIQKVSTINKFGLNENVGNTFETIWEDGGVYPWTVTAGTCSLVSDSASDTSTINVEGVTSDFTKFNESVTLNGLTSVNLTTSNVQFIYRMYVEDTSLVGDVTASIGGTTIGKILFDNNQTLMATYVVPKGYTAYITQGNISTGQGKELVFNFRMKLETGPWRTIHPGYLYENTYTYKFPMPLKIPEKTCLEVRAKNLLAGNVAVSSVFDIILIEN